MRCNLMDGSNMITKISRTIEGNKERKQMSGIEMITKITQTETRKTRKQPNEWRQDHPDLPNNTNKTKSKVLNGIEINHTSQTSKKRIETE
jgi:t-SNARE complex subunit (syntaxin)